MGFIAFGDPCAYPVVYVRLQPPDSSLPESYPLRKLSGVFKPGNVSRTVQDLLAYLLLR